MWKYTTIDFWSICFPAHCLQHRVQYVRRCIHICEHPVYKHSPRSCVAATNLQPSPTPKSMMNWGSTIICGGPLDGCIVDDCGIEAALVNKEVVCFNELAKANGNHFLFLLAHPTQKCFFRWTPYPKLFFQVETLAETVF